MTKIVGLEKEYQLTMEALKSRLPVLLYGPTGNGKTILARKVAEDYAKEAEIPVVYFQLYPELTKNTLIGGETIQNGSIIVKKQSIIEFGTKGAVIIIDEATHALEHLLLAFNSLIEEPYSTVIGHEIVQLHEKTRFIFCGNTPDHTGNIHLPISLANRLFILKMDLPSKEDIAKIGMLYCNVKKAKPLVDFVAEIIHSVYDASFPVSPRNIIAFARMLPFLVTTKFKTLPKQLYQVHLFLTQRCPSMLKYQFFHIYFCSKF